jgi:hypothetical protein
MTVISMPGTGIRFSTVAMIIVFITVGLARRRPLVGAACLCAWVFGFEAAWQGTLLIHNVVYRSGPVLADEAWLSAGLAWVLLARHMGIRANPYVVALTALTWTVWWFEGFHYNEHGVSLVDWPVEVINELAKTAWAFAYLLGRWPGSQGAPGEGNTRPAITQMLASTRHALNALGRPRA